MRKQHNIKPICFYLPQFHRIAENDRWWGKGFTEWTLVKAAKPLFSGHQQPEIPDADVGYYDACDRDTRRQQAALAQAYGIYGFCYYHYWFGGRRLLEKPLQAMLKDGEPDMPFCLCWANEPWSRRWSGEETAVLQAQVYGGHDDWLSHFNELLSYFTHKNYICVEGCPVFLIYRIGHIPDAQSMIACWRKLAAEQGLPGLHIVAVEGGFDDSQLAPDYVDAMAEHQPSCVLDQCQPMQMNGLHVYSIEEVWQRSLDKPAPHPVHYPGVCHAWDNTPRRGREGRVVLPSRPQRFRRHLEQIFAGIADAKQAPFVFVNAWNEWSEGAHLEPETGHGRVWLEAIRDALAGSQPARLARIEAVTPAPCPQNLLDRARHEPDPDLINVVMQRRLKVTCVFEFGCAKGISSAHIRRYVGADRYIALEPDPKWRAQAAQNLDEVFPVDIEAPDFSIFAAIDVDFLLCSELLGWVSQPDVLLAQFRALIHREGVACLGFDHAACLPALQASENGGQARPKRYDITQIRSMVHSAGFVIDKVYRIFSPGLSRAEALLARGQAVYIEGVDLQTISMARREALFCLRLLVFVRPV